MYILSKVGDSKFTKIGTQIFWLEFDEVGKFKEKYEKPRVGTSLIIDPYSGIHFTWQTTDITELIEDNDEQTHFKTKNSEYILQKPTL